MLTFDALSLLTFLFPGLVSAVILDTLAIRPRRNELARVTDLLMLSLIVYSISAFVAQEVPWLAGVETSPVRLIQSPAGFRYEFDGTGLMLLLATAVIVSIPISYFLNNDLHMRFARKVGLTRRTSSPSVWLDVFRTVNTYVIVHFSDGRRLYGWPEHYSDDAGVPFLYLKWPTWIDGDKYVQTGSEGILITPKSDVTLIEYVDPDAAGGKETNHGRGPNDSSSAGGN